MTTTTQRLTAYQMGYEIGLRSRIARVPVDLVGADRARFRSGFHDAQYERKRHTEPKNPAPFMDFAIWVIFALSAVMIALVSFASYRAIGQHDGAAAGLMVYGFGFMMTLAAMGCTVMSIAAKDNR